MVTSTNRKNGPVHAAIALGLLLAAAGCVTPKPVYKDTKAGPYTFTIGYDDKGCPSSAVADFANCNPSLPPNAPDSRQPKDCTRAKPIDSVAFVGQPGKEFELQFDPFGKSSIPSSQGAVGPLPFAPARGKGLGTSRTFTFRVSARGCEPLDPQIIIDW